jgi:hypothetical protein
LSALLSMSAAFWPAARVSGRSVDLSMINAVYLTAWTG